MVKYFYTKEEKDCCGCGACSQICTSKCIDIQKDDNGFLFPVIDNSKCTNCDRCNRVCPINEYIESVNDFNAYAVYANDSEAILNSSSGGAFPLLAEYILKNNGKVYGAGFNEKYNVYHFGIENKSELKCLLGSKYIQSNTQNTFNEVKQYLKDGRMILYTGTPCQIAALKLFLGKQYENLYTADVICHGVPSQLMFDEYAKYLEKKHGGKLIYINFRDKIKYGWSITLRYDIQKMNGKIRKYFVPSKLSEYFTGFLRGYILRESCYHCSFASLNRPGDITMGDYWGYQKVLPNLKHDTGLSIILVNSQKGYNMIQSIKESASIFPLNIEQAKVSENINLFHPTQRPPERDLVYKELRLYGFNFIARKYFRSPGYKKEWLKSKISPRLLKLIRKCIR
jgi:coenzyme F420-reducing hydrogenase beta subunit